MIRRLAISTFSKKLYKRPINYLYPYSNIIPKPNINFIQRQVYFSTQTNVKEFASQVERIEIEGEEVEEIDKSLYPELFPEEHNDADDAWFVDPAYDNPQENGDFIPLWQRKADSLSDNSSDVSKYKLLESDDLQRTKFLNIVRLLEEEGVENISVIDVRQKCDFTDWMIIGEGKTTRHLVGAVDGLYKMLKNETQIQNSDPTNSSHSYPIVEGRDSEDWVLIDTGSIFVHLFTSEARKYRNLEGLWEKIPPRSESKSITNEMVKEFKEFNPKLARNPPLPPEL
ncbi:Oligomerization domain-containing protein [Glomus cerebriforme]|uniref:Oligomerization domain-containing protein n=1 Tax=Glomus cerebriforme TaxID=658196 RepID=A0A397TEP8_9GLOM|nr:Oligomerization domain-containing protein [Glomus cerebriforme]